MNAKSCKRDGNPDIANFIFLAIEADAIPKAIQVKICQ